MEPAPTGTQAVQIELRGGTTVGGETIRNKAEELKGAAKEKVGDVIGDDSLQAEGATEKADAKDKQWQVQIDKEVEEINRP
jgi:uncharacterized protein YjbJ (UPF0337 family)